jgi:hypothetical protein
MLNFTIARLYKEKESDEWKETQSLGVHDLLPMAEALRESFRRASSPTES